MLNAICHNCFEFVFPGYWHFENGVTRVSEVVLFDPDGLPHVLALAVPLPTFLAGWSERIILGTTLLLTLTFKYSFRTFRN